MCRDGLSSACHLVHKTSIAIKLYRTFRIFRNPASNKLLRVLLIFGIFGIIAFENAEVCISLKFFFFWKGEGVGLAYNAIDGYLLRYLLSLKNHTCQNI